MTTRRLAIASSFLLGSSLLAGCAASGQNAAEPSGSPGPGGSPVTMSPMPVASEAPTASTAPVASGAPASPGASTAPASPGASMSAGTVVAVTVQEVAVVPETTTIPAGSVTLEVTNAGPAFSHEFLVVRTDLPADGLPTKDDGSFDEQGDGVEVLGKIEPFPPGTTQTMSVNLTPGHYVFLCNVMDTSGDRPFSHYAAGMRVDVQVGEAGASAAPAGSPAVSPAASPAPASMAPLASEAPAY